LTLLYVSVPVSKLPELVYETKKDVANSGLVSPILGHVGDGNFHALILFKTDEEKLKAKELVHRMVKRAIALDGTCEFFLCLYRSADLTIS
jgi:D-lactate dehydrogenase (cytochrome)